MHNFPFVRNRSIILSEMTKRTNYLTEVAEDPFNTKRTNYVAICENESSRGPRSYLPRKQKVQEPMKKLANSLPPTISHQKKAEWKSTKRVYIMHHVPFSFVEIATVGHPIKATYSLCFTLTATWITKINTKHQL